MKPAPFDFVAATSVAEAVALLGERDDARVIAGGQSLMQLLNFRTAQPGTLVDVNRIVGLDGVRRDGDFLAVGALTRHAALEAHPVAREQLPPLAEVIPYIGYAAVRHRGTIGGSFAYGAPYAELPLVAVTLGGEVIVEGAEGRRTIPIEEFFLGHLETAVGPQELVVEVRFRLPAAEAGFGFREIAPRRHDYAIASAAALVQLDSSGAVGSARIGVGSAHPTPVRVNTAEETLIGRRPDAVALAEAGQAAAAAIEPLGATEADRTYRRRVVDVMVQDALAQAIERSREAGS